MTPRNYWSRAIGPRRVAQLAPRVARPVAVHVFVPGPHTTGDLAAEPVCDRDDCGHRRGSRIHDVTQVLPLAPDELAAEEARRVGEKQDGGD